MFICLHNNLSICLSIFLSISPSITISRSLSFLCIAYICDFYNNHKNHSLQIRVFRAKTVSERDTIVLISIKCFEKTMATVYKQFKQSSKLCVYCSFCNLGCGAGSVVFFYLFCFSSSSNHVRISDPDTGTTIIFTRIQLRQ